MSFFFEQSAADAAAARKRARPPREVPIHLMKKQGCLACPRRAADVAHRMPSGHDSPIFYAMLGEAEKEVAVAGDDSMVEAILAPELRRLGVLKSTRFGYAIRCPSAKPAGIAEATCCSSHFERDVAETRPAVILGFGQRGLQWARPTAGTNKKGAMDGMWRGKRWPVRVGDRDYWYVQLQDLEYVYQEKQRSKYEPDAIKALRHDLSSLLSWLDSDDYYEPHVVGQLEAEAGVRWITGDEEMALEDLEFFLDRAAKAKDAGLDYETNQLRPYSGTAMILTAAVSIGAETLAFPLMHPAGWRGDPSLQAEAVRLFTQFLAESSLKVAHNLVFELEWTGHEISPELLHGTTWADSMAAMHTMDARRGSLSLGDTTLQLFGFDVKTLSNLDTARLIEYPLERVLKYNGLDAKWCLLAWREAMRLQENVPEYVEETWRKIRRAPVLALSQLQGVYPDVEYALQMEEEVERELAKAVRLLAAAPEVKEFQKRFGRPFSPTSTDDVAVLVRDVMKRPEGATAEGGVSTDDAVLSSIPEAAGIAPKQVLAHRAASKMLGTYIYPVTQPSREGVRGVVHADGAIHTNYNAMEAITGRLSSDNPNLQNYPKRKRKEVRGIIAAPPGHGMLACDYGQIEARVIAMASEDDVLVDSLWTDFDIHGHWADRFLADYPEIIDWIVSEFEVPGDDKKLVRKTLRQEAKNKWVFPQFFGSSFRSCAKNLHMPEDVADAFQREFWDQFKGVKRWQKRLMQNYEERFYVETLTGRRRRGPMSLNEIVNTPVQGTAADIVLDAMTRCSMYAHETGKWWYQPPINVHDDLTFTPPNSELEESLDVIARLMCDCRYSFVNVPILVEASYSPSRWHELKEVGVFRSDTLGIHTR